MAQNNFQLFTSLRYDKTLLDIPDKGFQHAGWNYKNRSSLYMLDFHRDRMLRAATFWGWTGAIKVLRGDEGLERLSHYVADFIAKAGTEDIPQRIKITLTDDGVLGHETSPTPATNLVNLFPHHLPPLGVRDVTGGKDEEGKDHRVTNGDSHTPSLSNKEPSKQPRYEVIVDTIATDRSEFTHFKTSMRKMYDDARARANISVTSEKEVLIVSAEDGAIMEGSVTTPYFWRNGRWVTPPVSNKFDKHRGSGGQDGTSRRWSLERHLAEEDEVLAASLIDGEECWLSNGVKGFICGNIRLGYHPN